MGKEMREQIYSVIHSMQKAIDILDKLLQENRRCDISELLIDCQDCAIAIGTKLEKVYGQNLETIHYLEYFCEQLYQMSLVLENPSAFSYVVQLKDTLEIIQQNLSKEMKKEVVFLPYKASMWDSLESVWLSAKEDEEYIAKVMPIPYYDRGEDGEFKELHWEGELFPDYVPITHYEEYGLEEHHPDMIFIHNPYDAYNTVTSIAPAYYSSKLKAYTDKLVYIPYFILGEITPNNEKIMETVKHYCLTKGVLNADTVVVESEEVRQVYIDILSREIGEHTRKQWEKKILGLGSPKIDKVMNTQKEDIDVPEEWLKIIQKPDGTWKKIVFYNISLNAFLKNHEIMLDKIESVLQTFKENQEDIALLWRPHPLYKSTIEAMRPEYGIRYQEIVDKYKKEGWGIFDDTADMNRAVALSDAYYGDSSSVARLYKKIGKLMMFQDPEIR